MPPRLVSLAILIYWSIATFFLLKWEVLPELSLGYPPDLRAIAAVVDEESKPVYWSINVVDDPRKPQEHRSVGRARTMSKRLPTGWVEMTSDVDLDSSALLRKLPFNTGPGMTLRILSDYQVDRRGDLRRFTIEVRAGSGSDDLFKVEGELRDGVMHVKSKGMTSVLNQDRTFPYESRGVVFDAMRPLDRLPGLHVGQRWDMRVVNPMSGAVETIRSEVERRLIVDWNGEAVSAFEVVQHAGTFTTRTFVRLDGVILRQQVPLPFVEMMLERIPDGAPPPIENRNAEEGR